MAVNRIILDGVVREQWSNGTQAGDPPSGYTAWDATGVQTAQRALTASEATTLNAQDVTATAATNGDTLRQRAATALTTNTNYLGVASPTNAQVVAQVQALTKECSALIRLLIGQLDSTAGA